MIGKCRSSNWHGSRTNALSEQLVLVSELVAGMIIDVKRFALEAMPHSNDCLLDAALC